MANFNDFVKEGTRRYKRIKGGYQNVNTDHGNWTGGRIGLGVQIGTNMSISAPVLSDWLGREATLQDMKNLTENQALDIYYQNYWLPIKGDQINSQKIANFLADMKSSGGGVWNIQKALNDLGENVIVDGYVGNGTLDAINRQILKSVASLNNAFRIRQTEYYLNTPNASQSYWISSLDRDYPEMSETAEKIGVPENYNSVILFVSAGAILLIIIIMLIWMKLK